MKSSMFLNVTHTIGCWKGTAIKFIKSTDSSNMQMSNTSLLTINTTQ